KRSSPRVAKTSAMPACTASRKWTSTSTPVRSAWWLEDARFTENAMTAGAADTLTTEVAVKPTGTPSATVVMIATEAAWLRNSLEKTSRSTVVAEPFIGPTLPGAHSADTGRG